MAETVDEIIKLDLGYRPAGFGSKPVIVESELSTFVVFKAVFSQRGADGKYQVAGLAMVEFVHCHMSKFGLPNNDAWAGHPLYAQITEADSWMEMMEMMEVRNSTWKAELERQNKVSYPDWDWPHHHYIISFRESTFECIAKDIKITVLNEAHEAVLQQVMQSVAADLSKY